MQTRNVYEFPLKSDVNVTKNGKVHVAYGQGGRSSRTGYTVSVFGGSGFLGRLLVSKLARHGTLVVAPWRNSRSRRHLKVSGDLGVVNFHEFDIRNIDSIEQSVAHADVVVNLIGSAQNTKNFSMADANIEASHRIAAAAKKYNVDRFIQVSSYNADPKSKSEFFATKGLGEAAVKEIYPDATIVRPAPMYGHNCTLLNQMFSLTLVGGNVLFRQEIYPTHSVQVAKALEKMIFDDSTIGKTYDLHGPERYSRKELREMLKYMLHIGQFGYWPAAVGYNIPAPEFLVKAFCYLNEKFNPSLDSWNVDALTRSTIDQVIDPKALGYEDLGMVPDDLADHIYTYVKPHILASSQWLNRTVYTKDEVLKLRDYVNKPKDSFDFLSTKS